MGNASFCPNAYSKIPPRVRDADFHRAWCLPLDLTDFLFLIRVIYNNRNTQICQTVEFWAHLVKLKTEVITYSIDRYTQGVGLLVPSSVASGCGYTPLPLYSLRKISTSRHDLSWREHGESGGKWMEGQQERKFKKNKRKTGWKERNKRGERGERRRVMRR